MVQTLERLASKTLFSADQRRLHVNRPLHEHDTPLHDHDFVEIAVVESGQGLHRCISGDRPARRGDVWVILPGQWHAWTHCRDLRLHNICLTSDLLHRELAWVMDDPELGPLFASDAILQLSLNEPHCQAVLRASERLMATAAHGKRLGTVLAILSDLAPYAPPSERLRRQDPLVRAVLADLERRPQHDWSLSELAARHGREKSWLGRQFRRIVGMPPMAWLARRRCERAAVLLLTTDLPVAEVGCLVGWPDPNYFARRFRAEFNQKPQQLPPATPPSQPQTPRQ